MVEGFKQVAKGRMKIGQRDQWRRHEKHKLRERGTLCEGHVEAKDNSRLNKDQDI